MRTGVKTSGAPGTAGAALERRDFLLPVAAPADVGEIIDASVLLVCMGAVTVGVAIENVNISEKSACY
ncbi:hypothetical protein PG994_005459 [Apiospora phragmitis]|uniref:Uncharacterized protein n=1 Tax=Apiospora phragmitis TaxID=2905665 RepID=A0ABR1VCD6_9PEZI